MASQSDSRPNLEHSKVKKTGAFMVAQEFQSSPPSETTEILDTDFDTDSQEDSSENSPPGSFRSLGTASVSSASTPDDVKTPDSSGLTGFQFHFDDNSTSGPTGPHLFRLSDGSMEIKSSVEVDLIFDDAPNSATTPLYALASKLGPERRDTPVPHHKGNPKNNDSQVALQTTRATTAQLNESVAASWTPEEVVMWMQNLNFDAGIVEKFFINDISGRILLELQPEDLKELDIHSFGKRHALISSIRQLRNSVAAQPVDPHPHPQPEPISREATPQSTTAEVGVSGNGTSTPDNGEFGQTEKEHQHHRPHRRRRPRVIGPNDSVSIVGIEQILPKLHRCSKGEECRKWQKQQARLSRLSHDLPHECFSGPVIFAGDPGNAATAQNLMKTPKSDVTPSIVASSDALGPNQAEDLPLSKEKLHGVKPRDPQENVRNFINFQRLSRLQPVNNPVTPPRETFPSPDSDSPNSLAENLKNLPRLQIPKNHGSSLRNSTLSPNLSGQRTITPSILQRKTSLPRSASEERYTSLFSPADFYRQDPHYAQSTPVSETDVPLTAIPVGPVERIFSQSVPPNMRYGFYGHEMSEPIPRPRSTKAENHRRKASMNNNSPSLARLEEGQVMGPIDTPEDLDRTPRATHCRVNPFSPLYNPNEITHSGWMKKRKTTRLLRHEWEDHHFALRGTELAMYEDEDAARRDSKALEHIDVDDYAVACSSLASSSKLTAAFKKTVLKRKPNSNGDTAFAFSLIPSPNNGSGSDRKSIFGTGSKSHHFAVRTRDERIDWMRELMLAKALRRGRETGASLNVNGTPI